MPAVEEIDLDELAAWIRSSGRDKTNIHSPDSLMRPPWRLTWHQACRALEALEARGDLERTPGPTIAYRPAPAPGLGTWERTGDGGHSFRPSRYALPLSPKEHAALLVGLEVLGELGDVDHALHVHFADRLTPDRVATLRDFRARLKRP